MEQKKPKNRFISRTVDRGVFYAPECPEVIVHKDFVFDENHKLKIKEVSRENIQELINAAAEDSGLKAVLSRILKENDVAEFNNLALRNEQIVDARASQKVDVNELFKNQQTSYDNAEKLAKLFGLKRDELLKLSNEDIIRLVRDASTKLSKSKEEVKHE